MISCERPAHIFTTVIADGKDRLKKTFRPVDLSHTFVESDRSNVMMIM